MKAAAPSESSLETAGGGRRRLARVGAAAASGVLLAAAHPPLDAGWLVFVALLPLLWAVTSGRRRFRTSLALGYISGAVFFLLNLSWVHHVTAAGMVLLALFLAGYVALWAGYVGWLAGRTCCGLAGAGRRWGFALLAAAAWTGLEWARGTFLSGFGWNGLGVGLRHWPALTQAADLVGATGLSFAPVFLQAALLPVLFPSSSGRARRRLADPVLAAALGLLVLMAAYGAWRLSSLGPPPGPALQVALVQPNVPQDIKNDIDHLEPIVRDLSDLTDRRLAEGPLDLMVWPESALPAAFHDTYTRTFLAHVLQRGDFVLVAGLDEHLMDTYYNSLAVARGSVEEAVLHRKVHLVPFGEFLPFRNIFGYFEFIVSRLPGDFDAGESTEPLAVPGHEMQLIPLICFEDTLPYLARKFARPRPQILVNVTNDAWFHDSAEAEQHLASAVLRCVELRRPMIRAANTGVTCVIDSAGRVQARLPRLQPGILSTAVNPSSPSLTVFARIGDSFSIALALTALAGAFLPLLRRRRAGH